MKRWLTLSVAALFLMATRVPVASAGGDCFLGWAIAERECADRCFYSWMNACAGAVHDPNTGYCRCTNCDWDDECFWLELQ